MVINSDEISIMSKFDSLAHVVQEFILDQDNEDALVEHFGVPHSVIWSWAFGSRVPEPALEEQIRAWIGER